MAEFYRATKIEELDRKHPGLRACVEEQYAQHTTHTEIVAMLFEMFDLGEDKVSVQNVSNHYKLRWWPRQNQELAAWREARNRYRILQEEQAKDPECDGARIIETLVTSGIVAQQACLAAADPLKLLAEQRKRLELAQHAQEIGIEKLRVENEKKALELKVQQLERERDEERKEIAGVVSDEKASPEDVRRKIREIYGIVDDSGRAQLGPTGGGAAHAVSGEVAPG